MNINIIRFFVFIYCTAIGYFFYIDIQPWTLDDAYITFRYAENWANGYGLVYNPGEYVEGYTSFLWVLILAGFHSIGFDTVITAKILCMIFSALSILLVMCSHHFIPSINQYISVIATLLLGTSGVFIPWSFSGMEVSLFCLLITIQVIFTINATRHQSTLQYFYVGLLSSLSIVCRPEGLMLTVFIFLFLIYVNKSLINYAWLKNVGPMIGIVLITIMMHYGLRYLYYGDWLPNTYYVKVGFSTAQLMRGFHYVTAFLPTVLGMVVFIVITLVTMKSLGSDKTVQLFVGVILLFCGYTLAVGGDSMPAFRFLVPVMPFLCILVAQSVTILFAKTNHLLLAILILVGCNAYQSFMNWHIHGHILSDRVAVHGKEVGLWMNNSLPPDAVIATNTAGSIAYYSKLTTIDMLGLTDNHIAHREITDMGQGSAGHEKGDGAYVLSRKPDVIQFASSLGAVDPMFRSGREMVDLPEFQLNYEAKTIGLLNGKDVVLYFRILKSE